MAEGDEVLEIGTGSGYLTACLAKLGREVLSIDLRDDLVEFAATGGPSSTIDREPVTRERRADLNNFERYALENGGGNRRRGA